MKRFSVFALCLFVAISAYCADNVPFNGLICDIDGLGLKAQITVKGSEKRTVSGKDGKFGLTNIKADDVLQLRYKKLRLEVAVEGRKSAKIVISDEGTIHSVTDDKELVAAGMDHVLRRELPTKGGVLTAEMIEREGFTNLADALRAKATSLIIDGAGNVTIRGVNSIGNHAPALIVCDGMEVGSINAVNINDVASVEIQRDGTLYGFRGVGGVISIKTKSGAKR
ncbi:MAG: TonB-dependent receptor plug domain-containing protein [Alistipes sp.]|nr:TonB-dependent receptor plug domain-containing protein [Alistipes sp.]MBQ7951949.1 TonB-dependent receptor plug domain-containing protein [Alistipes sp.]